ncbi:MAG: YlbF family regulator [Ruminococcaceae bacterium]|nr:YlbF family regulator [Oscillospiraceae bacterium]
MDEILQKAHELGELLAASTELARYQEQEIAFQTDESAQAAVTEYEKKSTQLAEEMRSGSMTPEKLDAFRKQMNENMAELTKNATAREYLEAKSAFNRVITQVNEILGYHIRGEEQDGNCSGHCSSCKGCH